ncbi:MAG: phosphate signaling complex protein PhoU [Christensenellales bacterium]|jgi:phosphate transport system protein
MRSRFDEQLTELNAQLIDMGSMIEYAIENSIRAMTERDDELAKRIVSFDREIDRKERDIEQMCIKLLLQQQPVARDLRLISAALKMVTDMERIGDQAADISEIVPYVSDKPYLKQIDHFPPMARRTIAMVKDAVDAFVKRDLALASAVIDADDEVDALFVTVKDELIELIARDATTGAQALDLLMIAKYLERIGDHATNLAEWVEFSVTGRHRRDVKV